MSLQHFHSTPLAFASFSLYQLGDVVASSLGGLDSDNGESNDDSDSSAKNNTQQEDNNATTTGKTADKTDTNTNTNTKTNTDTATNTATNTAATTDTNSPTTATENTTDKEQTTGTDTATTGTNTDKVTYNQWGFTGSQSVWGQETSTVTSDSKSSSASHSTHSVKGNKTSGANRISDNMVGPEASTWKKTLLLTSVVGISALLGVL